MDESMVDPSSLPPTNSMAPGPEAAPAAPAPSAPKPSPVPSPKVPFQSTKMFVILPILLIILVVAGGSYLISSKHGSTAPTIATTTIALAASNISTTVSASAQVASNSNSGNATCPCFSKAQVETLLNASMAAKVNATYNVTFEPTAMLLFNNINSSGTDITPPAAMMDNITGGWVASYNTQVAVPARGSFAQGVSGTGTIIETVMLNEYIISTSNAQGLYNYYQSFASSLPVGSVNGLTYYYQNLTISSGTADALTGYKGGYVVVLSLSSPFSGTAKVGTVAQNLSTALG